MKYVALKDGSIMTFYDNADYMQYDNVRENFLKEGNSIEELCDEFRELLPKYKGNDIIGYEPEKWEYSVSDKKFYNDIGEWCYVEDFIIRDYTVYGAIWTSKGLIYVAKMQEDGKLVLI